MTSIEPKKGTNWSMIILILVLIPILVLGFIYGYKKITQNSDDKSTNTANATKTPGTAGSEKNYFPLTGAWNNNEGGVKTSYVFDEPAKVNDTLQGKVEVITDGHSEHFLYQYVSDTKLKMTYPDKSAPWDFNYSFDANTQVLKIQFEDGANDYIRASAGTNNNAASNANVQTNGNAGTNQSVGTQNANNSQNDLLKQNALMMANGKWEQSNAKTFFTRKFEAPAFENGLWVGNVTDINLDHGQKDAVTFYGKYYMKSTNKIEIVFDKQLWLGKIDPAFAPIILVKLYEISADGKHMDTKNEDNTKLVTWTRK